MALSYIGKPISLISHSDIRYRGILAGIDPVQSTIQLSNVYSMGTETRRPPAEYIAPVQEPYQYIIFRASEVKDLSVDEPIVRRNVHDDPAVLGVSAPQPAAQPHAYNGAPPPAAPQPGIQNQPQPGGAYNSRPPAPHTQAPAQVPSPANGAARAAPAPRAASGTRAPNGGSVRTATVSMETVERALDDLRVSNSADGNGPAPPHGGRGGRRGGHGHGAGGAGARAQAEFKVPATDFDFAGNNARFDKEALKGPHSTSAEASEDGKVADIPPAAAAAAGKNEAYNPSKSFFDALTPSSSGPGGGDRGFNGRGGGRGGRGGGGRSRRDEEREKNVATFGEPGGVGLMGPGAYVGGWGGYGRRGGRGRRGGGVSAAVGGRA